MCAVCDVAWAHLVEGITAEVRAVQQATLTARALGSNVEVPVLDDTIARLTALVEQAPAAIDSADAQLRAALGLRVG